MPLVSVIIPSYNHERYVSESIESILGQSISDLELIIIDDASSDNSRQIIEGYKLRDNRIKAIFHDTNMGIARTINEGLDIAQGKFIAFTSSDDVWVEYKLEKQLKALEENEDLVVWAEGELIDAQSKPTGQLFTQRHRASGKKKSGDIFEELLKGNFIFASTIIFNSSSLDSIRFNESLTYLNDYRFVVDMARGHNYYFIPEPLAMYRIHGENVTISKLEVCLKEDILIRKQFLQDYGYSIKNATKARILYHIGRLYIHFNNNTEARRSIIQSIKMDPFIPVKILGMFCIRRILNMIARKS